MIFRLDDQTKPKAEEDEELDVPKVYYTSRTHTQLRQLTSELLKTGFAGGSIQGNDEDDRKLSIRAVPLGGRAQLCINAKVSVLQCPPQCMSAHNTQGPRSREDQRRRQDERCLSRPATGWYDRFLPASITTVGLNSPPR